MGRVLYKDYSRGTPPRVTEFNLNLHERYEHIDDPKKLVSLIVSRALMSTAISNIMGLDLEFSGDTIRDVEHLGRRRFRLGGGDHPGLDGVYDSPDHALLVGHAKTWAHGGGLGRPARPQTRGRAA